MSTRHRGSTHQDVARRAHRRDLKYLETKPPGAGEARQIADGLLWIRVPLPMELNHINLWLMEDDGGWTLVDTGMSADVCRDAWLALERDVCGRRPLRRIFITHDHPDHMGLAPWLARRHDAEVWMSAPARRSVTEFLQSEPDAVSKRIRGFVHSHGMDVATHRAMNLRGDHRSWFDGIPEPARTPAGGDELRVRDRRWAIVETGGHCGGHLCLHDAVARLLISGDQVLPAISPNVSVISSAPDADPLREFLESLGRLETLPEDTLVLPSHGRPFRALRPRIADLRAHHLKQLQSLRAACVEPRTAHELLPVMFGGALKGFHRLLALGEAVAHLNYLWTGGEFCRVRDGEGVFRFRIAPTG